MRPHKSFMFDCLGDLVTRARMVPYQWSGNARHGLYDLKHDMNGSCERALRGDTSLVPKAEELLDKLAANVEVPTHTWHASPYGAYAVVPEYIAGLPDPMRYKRKEPVETAPINLWINLATAITIPNESLLQRGVTILALVMALQRFRSVNLRFIYGCREDRNNVLITVNIDTTPLELSTVCYALCDPHFMHNILKGVVRHESLALIGGQVESAEECATTWGIPEEDIIIAGKIETTGHTWATRSGDMKLMAENPVEWINSQLKIYMQGDD